MRFDYPHTPRTDTEDDYHGQRIEDPYRWMEALDTPEIEAWIEAQNAVTKRYLASLPLRGPLGADHRALELSEGLTARHREPAALLSEEQGLQKQA